MPYIVRITSNAINDIGTFYRNTVRKYPNTWTFSKAILCAHTVVDEMATSIINGLNGERTPLLTNLRSKGVAELYTHNKQWYYTVRLQDDYAIIENAVYTKNESNRAYRRGRVNPTAPLSLDDRKYQGRIGTPPTHTIVSAPTYRGRIIKGNYYNGLRIASYRHKYTIVKSDGSPLTNQWFDEKPKLYKKPFGKYNIIAHVCYHGSLFAVDINGKLYDMHRLWNDAYLKENISFMLDCLVSESLRKYLHYAINESKTNTIRISEKQLHTIIYEIVNRLVA